MQHHLAAFMSRLAGPRDIRAPRLWTRHKYNATSVGVYLVAVLLNLGNVLVGQGSLRIQTDSVNNSHSLTELMQGPSGGGEQPA